MLLSKKRRITVGLIVLALVVAASAAVLSKSDPVVAQVPPGMGEGAPQRPPGGFAGRAPMGPSPMMGMGMGMMSGMPAIAATESYVYVVQGNTLYQFSAKTLKQVKKTQLEKTSPMPPRYPMEGPGPAPGQPAPPMAPGM